MKFNRAQSGSSLIIVLAFVLLLTLLAVVFLSRIQSSYPVSGSSANGAVADTFCKGALDQITGDLKQEIAAGSTVITPGGGAAKIYLPMNNAASPLRQNILPCPVLTGLDSSGDVVTTAGLTVVKESLGGTGPNFEFYSGATYDTNDYPPSNRAAANSSTATPSLNGRSVSAARWNAPLLMPVNPQNIEDYTPPAGTFAIPDWIYVARDGTNPVNLSSTGGNDMTSPLIGGGAVQADNTSYVVGRYAYVMYDEASLLDVNAAGMPTGTAQATQATAEAALLPPNNAILPVNNTINVTNSKGSVGMADLTAVGLNQNDIDQLVGWRNFASAQPTGSFPNYHAFNTPSSTRYLNTLLGINTGTMTFPVSSGTPTPATATPAWAGARNTGFLSPANQTVQAGQTDHLFSSRQELIQMLLNGVAGNNAQSRARIEAALPYLGTSSLALNSPSWMPVNPNISPGNPSGSAYNVVAFREAASESTSGGAPINQMPAACLVKTAFQRDDGTWAQVGDPLMKYRFPLRRLEWFNTANQAQYANQIQKWFCLSKDPNTGLWQYTDPDSSSQPARLAPANGVPIIRTLAEVAALPTPREPNFWEVLQAAILNGSLGDWTGEDLNNIQGNTNSPYDMTNDSVKERQIFQIGLNIIDQYNSNPAPTVIELDTNYIGKVQNGPPDPIASGSVPIAGVKNLPYIVAIPRLVFPLSTAPNTKNAPAGQPAPTTSYDGYNQFLMWNPHYNYASMPTSSIRIVPSGQDYFTGFPDWGDTSVNPTVHYNALGSVGSITSVKTDYTGNKGIEMDGVRAARFKNVDLVVPGDVTSHDVNCTYVSPNGTTTQVGFFMGSIPVPTEANFPASATGSQNYAYDPNAPGAYAAGSGGAWYNTGTVLATGAYYKIPHPNGKISYTFNSSAGNPVATQPNFSLQIKDPAGFWIPYQTIPKWHALGSSTAAYFPGFLNVYNFAMATAVADDPTGDSFNHNITLAYFLSDPRTVRFGMPTTTSISSASGNVSLVKTKVPVVFGQVGTFGGGIFLPTNSDASPGCWGYNTLGVTADCPIHYQDIDSVVRQGDLNVTAGTLPPLQTNPWENAALYTAPTAVPINKAEPLFLGRSFNSVADMGYANRDMPWKSLNFFTADSADGALLDFFSLSEAPTYAGGVNVNTASIPVLAALLEGAPVDTGDNTSGSTGRLNLAQATAIARAIRNYLGTTRAGMLGKNQPNAPSNPGNVGNNTLAFDPSDIPRINEAVTDAAAISPVTPPSFGYYGLPYGEKRTQEVVARALADSWNTRTWNLMIDIIAQTGRFPKGANTGNTDFGANFVVTGERREWAHVAIDRFTGKVLAVKVEPVNE